MLELRATHGTRFDDPAHRPRMRPGEGITGAAAELRHPVMIARQAHLDPRFRAFPNLPEDEYESILAVPVLARDHLAGALNVRTRRPREFSDDEVALLSAIAGQVGQAIENAKLYERSQRAGGRARGAGRDLAVDDVVALPGRRAARHRGEHVPGAAGAGVRASCSRATRARRSPTARPAPAAPRPS